MDEIKMEREIKEMLHQCADELHAPDSMQARVKFALNNAPARKRHLWSKRFVAVAAVAAIAVTGAFAAGGMGGIFSEGWSDQRLDLSSTQAHLADAGVALTLPDKIGEYTFSYGSDVDTTARNDMGETESMVRSKKTKSPPTRGPLWPLEPPETAKTDSSAIRLSPSKSRKREFDGQNGCEFMIRVFEDTGLENTPYMRQRAETRCVSALCRL